MRIVDYVISKIRTIEKNRLLRIQKKDELANLGSDYGGYRIYFPRLNSESIVYSIGIGEDLSFDNAIIQKLNCKVFAFDPTPKAIEFVRNHILSQNEKFCFFPIGVAEYDGMAQFHLPVNSSFVSGSMKLWGGVKEDSISVETKSINTIMKELGHHRINLLKMDIEGTEFDVLKDILIHNTDVEQICVEFHDRFFDDGYAKLNQIVKDMSKANYRIIDRERDTVTFLKFEAE